MLNIENKWVLITGASRGIGYEIASAIMDSGCKLILHSRTLEGTATMVKLLKVRGVEAYSVAAELDSEEGVNKLIEDVKEITGDQLDILYNNAGIMSKSSIKDYLKAYMVNCVAPAKLCDAFLPGMLKRDWGRIVNVTSGIENQPDLMAYSCSKAGLDRYVRDMIPTLQGTNVLMNLMDPGWLKTELGGPDAPNEPYSVIPGALIPIFLEKEKGSGKLYSAQDYK